MKQHLKKRTHSFHYQSIMMFCFLYSTVYASVAFVIHLCLLRAESRKIHVCTFDATKSAVPWFAIVLDPSVRSSDEFLGTRRIIIQSAVPFLLACFLGCRQTSQTVLDICSSFLHVLCFKLDEDFTKVFMGLNASEFPLASS